MKIFTLYLLLLCANVCRAQTPSALDSSLFVAVEAQDVARVQSLLANGANPNALNDHNFSIFNEAITDYEASPHKTQILRLLLRAGADPNALDGSRVSPLANAVTFDANAFRLILSASGPHKPDKETALVLAAYDDAYFDVVQRLLREGVSANASTEVSSVEQGFRATALMKAAAGSPRTVELLLQRGAR